MKIGKLTKSILAVVAITALALPGIVFAQQDSGTKHGSLSEVGAKLSNPVGDLWALTFSFSAPAFFDGDLNTGNSKLGGSMSFQPILPIPLAGSGDGEWRMITRPIVPIYFGTPTPEGFKGPPQNPSHIGDNILNNFSHESGLGDIQLPLMVNLPKKYAGNWLFGMGPVFQFPTATNDALGQDQWALGPAMVLGYKGKRWLGGIFPNYFWKIGSAGQDSNMPDVNQGSLLYFFNYSLPDAWQVGFNPTITYNHRAPSGNKWRVPVGLYVGKTIKMGKVPVNIKVGGEYVVVTQDTFGERFTFKFIITPVMPSLIESPIFGD